MNRIDLPALTADSALGFLAALGTLRLVAEDLGDHSASLGWPDGAFSGAALHSDRFGSIAELVASLNSVVAAMKDGDQLLPGVDGFPPRGDEATFDPTSRLSLADGRGLTMSARSTPPLARWLPAITGVVPPLEFKTGVVGFLEKNRFLKAGPGTVWVPRTLAGVRSVVDETALYEAFVGWRRRDAFMGAYLDHRADVEAATGQAARTPPKRGVPGPTFLALMALPMLPVRTRHPFSAETVGWGATAAAPKGFSWPVWPAALGVASIEALLDHPAVAAAGRQEAGAGRTDLAALGLSATFRALRIAAGNNDAALGPAKVLWSAS